VHIFGLPGQVLLPDGSRTASPATSTRCLS
jgi:hypothetical protein